MKLVFIWFMLMQLFKNITYYYCKILIKLRGTAVKNSILGYDSKVESGSIFVSSSLGDYSYCGYDCNILNAEIGKFCSLSNRIVIGGAVHPMHYVSTSPVFLSHKDSVKTKFSKHDYLPEIRTTLGHDVWVGENVMIKAGVTIGIGAVIGMGSVVTKDVPAYAVVAGNPARILRYRFDHDVIEALLTSRWWDLSFEELMVLGNDVNEPLIFLKKLKEHKCV
jgi:acetyltransferase-like isoleucine patch superfamily enzyme